MTGNFNSFFQNQVKVISDYEGQSIDENTHILICGDMLDSTVSGGGDASQIKISGKVGTFNKNFNLLNIYNVVVNKNNKIKLVLGNRDINKIKCCVLSKINNKVNDLNITNFNNGNLNLEKDSYLLIKTTVINNGWKADIKKWLPFWNSTIWEANNSPKPYWNNTTVEATSLYPFKLRFDRIFGVDGSIGTMSAGNLLYTIPFEILGIANIPIFENELDKEDYLAFVVLLAFNTMFNKNTSSFTLTEELYSSGAPTDELYSSGANIYRPIKTNEILNTTYISGLLYKFYKKIGSNVHFTGYFNDITNKYFYLFSHGGITCDLIDKADTFMDELSGLIKDNEKQITNMTGGVIKTNKFYSTNDIITKINLVETKLVELLNRCIDIDLDKEIPSVEMLLLLSLSAPYKPNNDLRFVMYSPINPGIDTLSTKSFILEDNKLIQVFGHVPKGYGPTIFTIIDDRTKKRSYLVNLDFSQSFKYSGKAGNSNGYLEYVPNGGFNLKYTLDIDDSASLKDIKFPDYNNKIILTGNKLFEVNRPLNRLFKEEELLKNKLENSSNIPDNVKIYYHGFDTNEHHLFTLSAGFNKTLVIYKDKDISTKELTDRISYFIVSVSSGLYYQKYLKYKLKYMTLRKQIQGGTTIPLNILMVSHNARMRCLLNQILGKDKIPRFQNCAIIKIELKINEPDTIELFYDGELSASEKGKENKKEEDKKIYFTKEPKKSDPKIQYVEFKKISLDLKKILKLDLDNNYTIYIVRHGQALHNTLKGIKYEKILQSNTYLDATLTNEGKEQAIRASEKIAQIDFNYLFISKLRRTAETGRILIHERDTLLRDPIVLPCSHELNYTNKQNCDKANSGIFKGYTPPENKSICENNKLRNNEKCNVGLKINWKHYDNFTNRRDKKEVKCRDTNMIREALHIIKTIDL